MDLVKVCPSLVYRLVSVNLEASLKHRLLRMDTQPGWVRTRLKRDPRQECAAWFKEKNTLTSSSWDDDRKLILSHCCLFRDPRSRVREVHLSLLRALFLDLNLMENNVGVEWERPLAALADCLQIRKTVDAHAGLSGDGVIWRLSLRGMACICCNFWEKKNILMKNEGYQQNMNCRSWLLLPSFVTHRGLLLGATLTFGALPWLAIILDVLDRWLLHVASLRWPRLRSFHPAPPQKDNKG